MALSQFDVGGTIYPINAAALDTPASIDGIAFDGGDSVTHYAVCSTAAGTAAKTATAANEFTLATGSTVSIKFTYGNTAANPTLNISGTGAMPIMTNGTTAAGSGAWAAGECLDLRYDGTNWLIVSGAIASTSASGRVKMDSAPTSGSNNAPTSGSVYSALATKQNNLTFDATPTDGSTNPVTSNGVYDAIRQVTDYALAAFPTATLTDQSIASFDDGADDIPVKDLTVSIEPVQAGSGDPTPDNVRLITGWTGANIARTGKNLFKCPTSKIEHPDPLVTLTPNGDGSFTLEGEANSAPDNFYILLPVRLPRGTTVTISLNNSDINNQVGVRLMWQRPVSQGGSIVGAVCLADVANATRTYTVPATWDYANLINVVCATGHDAISPITLKVQVEIGDTASAWEPYMGESYPVSWQTEAGTVYGGTLDVTTGLLTVTRAMVDAGTLAWGKNTALTNAFSGVLAPQGNLVGTNPFAIMCSKYKTAENISSVGQLPNLCITGSINDSNTFRFVFIRDSNYAEAWENNTPNDFKAALDGVQISYVLTEPLTYQLTPTEIKTLLGLNNIWADTGNVSVTYRADPTLFINGKVAALTALMSES